MLSMLLVKVILETDLAKNFGGPLIPTLLCIPSSHLHQLQGLDIHINKDSENLLISKERHW